MCSRIRSTRLSPGKHNPYLLSYTVFRITVYILYLFSFISYPRILLFEILCIHTPNVHSISGRDVYTICTLLFLTTSKHIISQFIMNDATMEMAINLAHFVLLNRRLRYPNLKGSSVKKISSPEWKLISKGFIFTLPAPNSFWLLYTLYEIRYLSYILMSSKK